MARKYDTQLASLKTQASEAIEQMGKAKNSEGKVRGELIALGQQREFEINEFTKAFEE